MNNLIQAKRIANHLISQAKQWMELCDKREIGKMVAEYDQESSLYSYRPANPGEIALEIKKQINDLEPKLQEVVLTEISEISKEADKGIEANGGCWHCDAGITKKACNAIKSFYEMSQDTPTA